MKYKVGDRVRYTGQGFRPFRDNEEGLGTIIYIDFTWDGLIWAYKVLFDNGETWYCHPARITGLEPDIKDFILEITKT